MFAIRYHENTVLRYISTLNRKRFHYESETGFDKWIALQVK